MVDDPAPARAALTTAQLAAQVATTDAERERHEATVREMAARLEECVVEVAFVAIPPRLLERLTVEHTAAGGDVDRETLLPALAAACAEDHELRDVEWWAGVLDPEAGVWTKGERDALYHLLFVQLNQTVPRGRLGKG